MPLNPEFGGDEQLFSGDTALTDALAHRFFIPVGSGGVNVGIARLDRIHHAAFAFGWIGNLKDAEPQDRDFNAIVYRRWGSLGLVP